jgi:tRNA-modifying protein YgfZ
MTKWLDQVVSNRILLRRCPGSALIRVTGADAAKWLQGIVTSDLNALKDKAFWGLMLQRSGKVRCELVGLVVQGGIWISVVGGEVHDVHSYLDSLILMDDVNLTIELGHSLWAIHAAGSADACTFGVDPSLVVAQGSLRWTGDCDRLFVIEDARQAAFLSVLHARNLEPCSEQDFEQLRVSSGIPKWLVDYSQQDTPHHAGLFGRAVAEKKGCYIGQEVVCKTEMIGRVSSRLTRIEIDSIANVHAGAEVQERQTGESAGVVTSVAGNASGPSGWAIARLKTTIIQKQSELTLGESLGRIVDML